MTITRIAIDTPDGTAEAYLAKPDGENGPDRRFPGVLFYMDAIGLRPRIEVMVERIASWGYAVLAPNLFYRHRTVAEIAPTADLRLPDEREKFFPTVMPLVNGHTAAEAARDADCYLATLAQDDAVRPGPIGVTGYCMGGRLALRVAAQRPEQVGAVGMFHVGGLVTDAADSPHLCIPQVRAEVLAGYADADQSMTPGSIATVDELLTTANVVANTSIRPGAPHGYTMADTSSYDEAAAEWHFDQLRDLFDRTLLSGQDR